MEKYIFKLDSDQLSYHEVFDKFHFYRLLWEIGNFKELYSFDTISLEWKEEIVC